MTGRPCFSRSGDVIVTFETLLNVLIRARDSHRMTKFKREALSSPHCIFPIEIQPTTLPSRRGCRVRRNRSGMPCGRGRRNGGRIFVPARYTRRFGPLAHPDRGFGSAPDISPRVAL
jgi:hypothetical protein